MHLTGSLLALFMFLSAKFGLERYTFPENMRLKYFPIIFEVPAKSTGNLGDVHTLMCPILNKDLEKELLCGLDPGYSTSNFIIYSGFINMGNMNVNLFCIDLVVDNMLKNFNTRYLWHGKCFMNSISPTEVLLKHDLMLNETKTNSIYSMKINNKVFYEAKLPTINDQNYEAFSIADDQFLSTTHIHLFNNFYTNKVNDYCPTDSKLETGIMTINFGKVEGLYMKKLDNLDDVFIDENFGKIFGFVNPLNKESLDTSKCVATFIKNIKYMDTGRVIAVDKDANIPPLPTEVSLSTTETLPKPYDNMDRENIRNLKVLTELQKSKSFDINNAIMDFFYDGKL